MQEKRSGNRAQRPFRYSFRPTLLDASVSLDDPDGLARGELRESRPVIALRLPHCQRNAERWAWPDPTASSLPKRSRCVDRRHLRRRLAAAARYARKGSASRESPNWRDHTRISAQPGRRCVPDERLRRLAALSEPPSTSAVGRSKLSLVNPTSGYSSGRPSRFEGDRPVAPDRRLVITQMNVRAESSDLVRPREVCSLANDSAAEVLHPGRRA
jgi:hypothetical protein